MSVNLQLRRGRFLDPVTIGGSTYWASVTSDPIGGVIQRKTNGSGTLLRAWGKARVTISGEGDPPAVSGTVAIASAVYTGNVLVLGIAATRDSGSGRITWTLSGEQP